MRGSEKISEMPFTSPLSVNTSKMDGRKSDGVFAGHLRWKMLLTVLFILNLMTSPLANEFTAPENVYIGEYRPIVIGLPTSVILNVNLKYVNMCWLCQPALT